MTAARVLCAFVLAGVTFVSDAWVGRMDERAKWQHSIQIGTPLTVGRTQ